MVRELAVHLQKWDMFFMWVHSEVSHRYITLLRGPLVLFQNLTLKFPQLSCSFASQQHTDVSGRCRGWGWGRQWCHGLNSSGWAGVCAQRLRKEGRKRRFRRTGSCGSCGCQSAKDAGQLEHADWPTTAGGCVLASVLFPCVILNEKSDNSSAAGCPIERQIPGLDIKTCSCPHIDLGAGKTRLFLLTSFSETLCV